MNEKPDYDRDKDTRAEYEIKVTDWMNNYEWLDESVAKIVTSARKLFRLDILRNIPHNRDELISAANDDTISLLTKLGLLDSNDSAIWASDHRLDRGIVAYRVTGVSIDMDADNRYIPRVSYTPLDPDSKDYGLIYSRDVNSFLRYFKKKII